jgi:hypothetical protein
MQNESPFLPPLMQGITDDLNLYSEIRSRIASLTDILKDMNTLTPDLHLACGGS